MRSKPGHPDTVQDSSPVKCLACFAHSCPHATRRTRALIDREMHTMFLTHGLRCPYGHRFRRISHLGVTAPPRNMAVFAEYAEGVVRHKYVAQGTLPHQLVANG